MCTKCEWIVFLQQAFTSNGQNPLTDEAHNDEFVTGGSEKMNTRTF